MQSQISYRLIHRDEPRFEVVSSDPSILLDMIRRFGVSELFRRQKDLWDDYYCDSDLYAVEPTEDALLEALPDDFFELDELSRLHLVLQSRYAQSFTLTVSSGVRVPAVFRRLLIPLLGTDDLVSRWWASPNKAFDDCTPADLHFMGGVHEARVADYVMSQVFR